MRVSYILSFAAALLLAVPLLAQKKEAPKADAKPTLENLQAAYDGESNASAKYLEYAKKADEEGYKKVGAMFRGAAESEKIHAANHAKVIKKLGATPKAEIKKVDVKSTKENLEEAIKGESYERDTMYPDYMAKAKEEGQKDALRSFTQARNVEANHAKMYQKALDNLDQWKVATDFFVCRVCGNLVEVIDFEKCPVCREPKSEYKKVQ